MREAHHRLCQLRKSCLEEAERATEQYRFNLSNMGAVTEEEKVAAMIAQNAFQKYNSGRYPEAYTEYKRAREIAPRFASVYRNWAVMESIENHLIEAEELMKKAANLSPDDPQIWLTWGNIKRKHNQIKDALDKYQRAYDLDSDDAIILNSLGQAKSRSAKYEEADNLFRAAIEKNVSISSNKHEIINRSSLAENLKRWAESLAKDRNYKEADEKLKESLEECLKVVKLDKNDIKSVELLNEIYRALGFFYRNRERYVDAISYFQKAIIEKPKKYREIKYSVMSAIQAAQLLISMGKTDAAKRVLSLDLKTSVNRLVERDVQLKENFNSLYNELQKTGKNEIKGSIVRVNSGRGFVIIESLDSQNMTYLGHINDFISRTDALCNSMQGKKVKFIAEEYESNGVIKKKAKSIRFIN